MRLLWTVLLLAGAAGCEPEGHPVTWHLTDGTELRLDLGEPSSEESRDGRVAYQLESGISVAIQEISVESRAAGESRTPVSVARALAARLELGEREGELLRRDCHLRGVDAECLDGAMTLDGREHARHGAVLRAGERLVWIDVSGPLAEDERVRERARLVLESVLLDEQRVTDG